MSRAHAAARAKDERLNAVFHALADTTRRRMIDRLARGPLPVTELAEPFPMSLAAISKHLDVLEHAGIVRRERDGRFQRCHLTPEALDDANGFIEHYRSFWQSTLDQLAEYLESDDRAPLQRGDKGKRR
jgi:DNA-binding transcriptional ArsR family regulator